MINHLPLYELLEEQQILSFTGRVLVIADLGHNLVMTLFLNKGAVTYVHMPNGENSGLKSLLQLLWKENQKESFTYNLEPEELVTNHKNLPYSSTELLSLLEKNFLHMHEFAEYRPADNLKLVIKPNFIHEGYTPSGKEFDVLCLLSEYSLVGDLYRQSMLFDFELTAILMNLRKKGVLDVMSAGSK